ncbi:hypothetical protein DJ83_13705 [Halorubrum ezzemoulense]|uniref:Uncharacterized protein n=2 Tax=Halorubrum ezzemoulense TaxID=337243 RepID=A0A1X4H9X4_HALEZ|nr:hypothetical protein [Halorubrum ezzemoulense]MDB2240114.1 hypothetical protein [Halorubrum ezzemoulense]OSP09772.1 hypothetical protein B9H04_04425 [Halorubrum ezzemoulense DSM 17463]OYR59047.1 hypothetical protein DJ83_13705 [Halorubrum ezzemoulense]
MNFTTEAHLDEYIIDGENTVSFSASDGELTYRRPSADEPVSIPVRDITSVEFERDTSLHRHTFLGLFFLVLSLVLTVGAIGLVYTGRVETRPEIAFAAFLGLFAVGGWNTTRDFLSHSDRDVIDVYVNTEAETHVLCGEVGHAAFVDACGQLIDSDVPTTNRNRKLATALE